ncbi:MAG: hypothetical protein FLDDKLPJ_01944 [Phycisphaerae bacterium]|nr:hypothetical protein [Phycisphaerae bacterium]
MNAFDTNVLLYAHDPRNPSKQAIAAELIQRERSAVLLWQVACEYLSASRKLVPLGYRFADAQKDLDDLRLAWTLMLPTWSVVERASDLVAHYSFSFWDAMLVAAGLDAKVETLFSEDLTAYPEIDGLRLVNPFAELGDRFMPHGE